MSTWRGKALELLLDLKQRVLASKNRREVWQAVQLEFHATMARKDDGRVAACLRYAAYGCLIGSFTSKE